MLKEHKNSKVKGTVGLGHAIAYFTRMGMTVALPLNDSQSYDLIIDENGCLKKVQVKTSTNETIGLRTTGGNQSFHTAKLFNHASCDYVYALIETGESWLIPTNKFTNVNGLKVTDKKYDSYKLI